MSRLGEFLMQEGLLGPIDRRIVLNESVRHAGSFARGILHMGILDEEELGELLASKTSFRRAAKDITYEMDPDMGEVIPKHIAAWLEVLPLVVKDDVLSLAMIDPTDLNISNQIRFFTNLRVRPVIATRSEILRGLRKIGAELPVESELAKGPTSVLATPAGAVHNEQEPAGAVHSASDGGLGVTLIQKSEDLALDINLDDVGIPEKKSSSGQKFDQIEPRQIAEAAPRGASPSSSRMDNLILGLGAMTDHKSEFYARPRSSQPELSVAVQAAISVLKRFQVKLQLTKNIEEALRLFLSTVKKAGLTNGIIVRVSNGNIVLGAHWIDAGLDVDDGLTVPDGIDRSMLTEALRPQYGDQPWISLDEIFKDRAERILNFWNTASAKPETVFAVERHDGGLVCLVAFTGQYNHDGLRQIFYDALKTLNSRL